MSLLGIYPQEWDCWVSRSYGPSFPKGWGRALSTAARSMFPPAVPTAPRTPHPPAPRQKGILIPPADLRSPNGTNVISHFLSSAHISLLTGDSAHPFWGLLPLGCLLLFKEMVTVITKTSLSSPGPSSATTESEPLEASQLLALAVGQRIIIAPIY